MMNAIANLTPQLIISTVIIGGTFFLISLTALAVMYNHFHKTIAHNRETIRRMQEDLSAMCKGAIGVGEHLARLEERTRGLIQRQDQLEMQEAPERSFKQAIKMVRNGANLDQLISDCGLARGEAELVMLANNLDRVN